LNEAYNFEYTWSCKLRLNYPGLSQWLNVLMMLYRVYVEREHT